MSGGWKKQSERGSKEEKQVKEISIILSKFSQTCFPLLPAP